MSSDQFNIDHPHGHKTRDGRRAKIINTEYEFDNGETIVALIDEGGSIPTLQTYFSDGRRFDNDEVSDFDIINAPAPKRKGIAEAWINVYPSCSVSYETRDAADAYSQKGRIACLHVREEVEEGTGLDEQPEPEEPKTVHLDFWVNVYGESFHELAFHKTHDDAVLCQRNDGSLLQCIHIERDAKVGEGLDD